MKRSELLWFIILPGVLFIASNALSGCMQTSSGTGAEAQPESTNVVSDANAPHKGGTVVVGMAADSIVTLDPAAYSDRPTETVIRNIFDGLVTRTTDNQVVPELAQTYRWLDDKTVEFKLKQGVKFHNGDELTADDVVFTFDRIIKQDIGAPRRVLVNGIERVEKADDYTVRFHLKNPWPVFFQLLVHTQIVPKDYLTRVGDEEFAQNPVGSGPFKFVEGNLNEQIVLERFDDYYGGADALPPVAPPLPERVIFKMMPDTSTRLEALQDGTVHIIQNLPPHLVSQLNDNAELTIKAVVGTRPKFVELNTTILPFNDVRVRRALNYAVDADAILASVAADYGVILPGPLSPANLYADPTLEPYGYNPDRARALLAEAGYTPQELSFTIDAYDPYVEIAEAVAEQLQTMGMDVDVQIWQNNEIRPLLLDCKRQAVASDWGDSAFDPVGYIEAKWQTRVDGTSAGRGNFSCYSNPTVDELIEAGASEPDAQQRREIYNKAQRLIYQDAPAIFLYVPQEIEAVSANVRNWQPSPDSRLNLHDVWLAGE